MPAGCLTGGRRPAATIRARAGRARNSRSAMGRTSSLAAILLALGAAPLAAQGAGSTLSGRVLTAEGRPIPGARIVKSGTTDTTRADSSGRYRIEHIPAGHHLFTVRQPGFQLVEMELTLNADT